MLHFAQLRRLSQCPYLLFWQPPLPAAPLSHWPKLFQRLAAPTKHVDETTKRGKTCLQGSYGAVSPTTGMPGEGGATAYPAAASGRDLGGEHLSDYQQVRSLFLHSPSCLHGLVEASSGRANLLN